MMKKAKIIELEVDYFDHDKKKVFDKETGETLVKIYSGDCYVTNNPKDVMTTVLGSCVAVCVRDPILNIGGMNHFLLPATESTEKVSESIASRYGAYSMEKLINSLLKMGGVKSRLELKIFGGANVGATTNLIGSKNVEFITNYIKAEGLKVIAQHLGGTQARRVNFHIENGKAMMKLISDTSNDKIIKEEFAYREKVIKEENEGGDVDLF